MFNALYAFDFSDASQRAIWSRDSGSSTSAAAAVNATWTCPGTQPFLLRAWGGSHLGGAAQFATRWRVGLLDPGLTTLLAQFGGGEFVSTTAAVTQYSGQGFTEIVVPPRYSIRLYGDYNAGAAANSTTLYVYGFFIPRGTLGLPG